MENRRNEVSWEDGDSSLGGDPAPPRTLRAGISSFATLEGWGKLAGGNTPGRPVFHVRTPEG